MIADCAPFKTYALDPADAGEVAELLTPGFIMHGALSRGGLSPEDSARIDRVIEALEAFMRGNVIITPEQGR